MSLLEQLKDLLWSAVPAILLLIFLYFFLRANFFGPLAKVMAERAARSEGARKEADAAQAAAAEKTRAYQDALKRARMEIYTGQDESRRTALEARAAMIREARTKSQEEIRAGKEALSADAARARKELESASQALAGEMVKAILQPRSAN